MAVSPSVVQPAHGEGLPQVTEVTEFKPSSNQPPIIVFQNLYLWKKLAYGAGKHDQKQK